MSPNTIPCAGCKGERVRHKGERCAKCDDPPILCRLCGKPLARPRYDGSLFIVHAHTLRWACDHADLLAKRAAEAKGA
jgi:hypothetical protein